MVAITGNLCYLNSLSEPRNRIDLHRKRHFHYNNLPLVASALFHGLTANNNEFILIKCLLYARCYSN